LNAGLTQVLNDGTNTYIYGIGRIAQVNTSTLITDYFMTDALGSVRQLTDAQGEITLANAYDPYGSLAQNVGGAQTSYGFTGEFTDPSGMVYLRARYYMPNDGRFLTRDTWMGDYNSPLSLNRWMYVEGNPINYTDPSGRYPAGAILAQALSNYSGSSGSINILDLIDNCFPLSSSDDKQYDLTWWLALAISRHGNDSRVKAIARDIDYATYNLIMSPSERTTRFLVAYAKFYNLEGPWKVWDVKRKIQIELGNGIILCGATCDWFDYSTPGNIHFGFVAYRAKINQAVAAIAGGALEQLDAAIKERRLYPEYCSQNASKLFCDNPGDQAAVDFGYMLAEKYQGTPTITEKILRSELTPFWMSKFQRPPAGFKSPFPAALDIRNDYSADHFNN
jgi:RHS repeat-associated protein